MIYFYNKIRDEYKSLVRGMIQILLKNVEYNADILENSDIFFHDVLTGDLDYKSIGLSTLKYSVLDIQNKKDYDY